MISEERQNTIVECARKFGARTVWLFGSAMKDGPQEGDFDIAVDGVPPENIFKLHFRLSLALPRPVDLVDLSLDPPIASIILAYGVCLYER